MKQMHPTPLFDRLTGSRLTRRLIRWCVTVVVVALVIWFAGDTLRQGWDNLSSADISIAWPWVAASALLYILGLTPMAFYWRLALRSLGQEPRAAAVVRGYYLGHLGKYVPGKAMVAVLRTGVLVRAGCDLRLTLASVFIETLTFMATGGMLAALLLAASGDGPTEYIWLAAGLAALVGVPITPPVARRLVGRILTRQSTSDNRSASDTLTRINWPLMMSGIACAAVAWTLIGLSLWAAVRAVDVGDVSPINQLYLWVEAVTLPVVAGFLSLIPGGLIVRDAMQVELLTPTLPSATALVVAGLWRLISVASEAVTCAILEVCHMVRR